MLGPPPTGSTVGAREARDAVALLPPLFSKGRVGVGFALADSDDY
jgi:hypothetical protein